MVCPLVRSPRRPTSRRATEMAERLQRRPVQEFGVGLVHGRLSFDAKDQVMRAFKARARSICWWHDDGHLGGLTCPTPRDADRARRALRLASATRAAGASAAAPRSPLHPLAGGPASEDAQRLAAMEGTQTASGSPRSISASADRASSSARASQGSRSSGIAGICHHAGSSSEARQDAAELVRQRAIPRAPRLPDHRRLRRGSDRSLAQKTSRASASIG